MSYATPAKDKSEFILWMADRYGDKANLTAAQALEFAAVDYEEMIDGDGIEFGAPSNDWTRGAAYDLVDESMSCWDAD